MSIYDDLEKLKELRAQKALVGIHKQDVVNQALGPEMVAKMAEIDAEFEGKVALVDEKIKALEEKIRAQGKTIGSTVKVEGIQAIYTPPKRVWNDDMLWGYAATHPEVLKFFVMGKPVVSIRE